MCHYTRGHYTSPLTLTLKWPHLEDNEGGARRRQIVEEDLSAQIGQCKKETVLQTCQSQAI